MPDEAGAVRPLRFFFAIKRKNYGKVSTEFFGMIMLSIIMRRENKDIRFPGGKSARRTPNTEHR
ncbi:MAG: hypothetical protein D3914_06310 [Candidatus Electrothrix sp. LOE2]|nr:hypothetical protein [Candidatus Electrothrix sp. LOE2]